MPEIDATSNNAKIPAVNATNSAEGGVGVFGACKTGHGVRGESDSSKGVVGTSKTFQGVYGHSDKNAGVVGESSEWVGVYGKSMGATGIAIMGEARLDEKGHVSGNGTGVFGASTGGHGVEGTSIGSKGVVGTSVEYQGVFGHSDKNAGVVGESSEWVGVYGKSLSPTGIAIMGEAGGTGIAGHFAGNVHITGDCQVDGDVICTGADLAEQFCVVGGVDATPGSVVVLAGDDQVRLSDQPYDHRVAGIVSGAGAYRPALVLDSKPGPNRRPLALTGKVWCKVDAANGPISVGDLLTTSSRPGHAMRAADPAQAFGSVIGKALADLTTGVGLIPVLVSLQ